MEKSEEFAKMVEDEETMVKAHEVLGQLLVTIASEGTYLADAPEDVRKSAESLFSWLQTEGFIDESVTAKFAPSEHEPAQRRFMKVFSRLASMFKGETAAQDDDEAIMAALEDAMPRFAAGVRLIKTSTATPAQKRAGIAYLIDDLNQTITKHGKFKHDNKVHARASAAATS